MVYHENVTWDSSGEFNYHFKIWEYVVQRKWAVVLANCKGFTSVQHDLRFFPTGMYSTGTGPSQCDVPVENKLETQLGTWIWVLLVLVLLLGGCLAYQKFIRNLKLIADYESLAEVSQDFDGIPIEAEMGTLQDDRLIET